jgi:hypothetical protein
MDQGLLKTLPVPETARTALCDTIPVYPYLGE